VNEMIVNETPNNVLATREAFAKSMPAMASALAAQVADMPLYLSLPSSSAHKGRWGIGPDLEPVEMSAKFAVDPTSIEWGYTVFVAGRPVASSMVPMTAGAPTMPTHDDQGNALTEKAMKETTMGYRVTMYRKDGRKVILRGATQGLRYAIANLVEKVLNAAKESDQFAPVVSLGVDHYTHPVHGTVYTPKVNVVSWMKLADLPS